MRKFSYSELNLLIAQINHEISSKSTLKNHNSVLTRCRRHFGLSVRDDWTTLATAEMYFSLQKPQNLASLFYTVNECDLDMTEPLEKYRFDFTRYLKI